MPKVTLDSRIPALVRNGVQTNQRSFIVLVGDRGRDQVVNLHWLLSQTRVSARPSVLWCYKKDLGFTSSRSKREKKIRREVKRGIRETNSEDPFEVFVSATNIRYTYYRETDKILGQTFGMCVLQDFEALTPNLLARTVETVEGGGIVCILLRTMSSLRQLYTLSMDIHSRYRTEMHNEVVARFNERFLLSLGSCSTCLVLDDELNVIPISGGRSVEPLPKTIEDEEAQRTQSKIAELRESRGDDKVFGTLLALAKTLDQANALEKFLESVTDRQLSTVTLTAARGRGKSACLGLAVAAAIFSGYSNIFLTSPSPENLKTLFEFLFKGLTKLGYEEHLHYDIIQSKDQTLNKAVVRVSIFKDHRQTVQYVEPTEFHTLGQAELVVIDEAAAIPLPIVQKMLGNYLVFMASTVNGYEGTGRSLSLKLIQKLRAESRGAIQTNGGADDNHNSTARSLREITLSEPIRYAKGDPVEKWLSDLLCLDATLGPSKSGLGNQPCPHPSTCNLFHINRDTLFSFHPISEVFLQKVFSLFVASHYKNSPNDLQLMSDAPAHQLFVLLPHVDEKTTTIPEPLCVIQIALEGKISKDVIKNGLSRGNRSAGDLIPWLVSQQFQDNNFGSLSGARIVRIATHPEYMDMGYGQRALQQLTEYFEGKFNDNTMEPEEMDEEIQRSTLEMNSNAALKDEVIAVRDAKSMPPLLLKLSEKPPTQLDYLGVSYGMTPQLHKFWKRCGYVPVYIRQTTNDLTGEHTCVMLKTLEGKDSDWLTEYAEDFKRRFLTLLSYQLRSLTAVSALSIIENASKLSIEAQDFKDISLDAEFTPFDLKRLDSFAQNLLEYHVILDMIPRIAYLYFTRRFGSSVTLSGVQGAILLSIGLQRKTIVDIEGEFGLPASQILAMFIKVVRKVSKHMSAIQAASIEQTLPAADGENLLHTEFRELANGVPESGVISIPKTEESIKRKKEEYQNEGTRSKKLKKKPKQK